VQPSVFVAELHRVGILVQTAAVDHFAVRAVTRDGKVINGRRLNEDTYTVQLIDDRERLMSLNKSELREYTISTVSPMPSFKGTLTDEEIADVVAYLLSLKGR